MKSRKNSNNWRYKKEKASKIIRYNPSKNSNKEHLAHTIPINSLLSKATQAIHKNDYPDFCQNISNFVSKVDTVLDIDFLILVSAIISSPECDKYLSYSRSLPQLEKFYEPSGKIYDNLFFGNGGGNRMAHLIKQIGYGLLNDTQTKFLNKHLNARAYNFIIEKNTKDYLANNRYARVRHDQTNDYDEACQNKKRHFLRALQFLDSNYDLGKNAKFKKTLKYCELEQIKINYFFHSVNLTSDKPKDGEKYQFIATPYLSIKDAKEIFKDLKISPSLAAKHFSENYRILNKDEDFVRLYLDKLTEKSLSEEKSIGISQDDLIFFLEECVKRSWRIGKFKHNLINHGYYSRLGNDDEYKSIVNSYSDKQELGLSLYLAADNSNDSLNNRKNKI